MLSIEKIAEEIRVAMARQNIKDAELAEKSGVHRTTISAIKLGTIENPQIKTLQQVANALGLELRLEISQKQEVPIQNFQTNLTNGQIAKHAARIETV